MATHRTDDSQTWEVTLVNRRLGQALLSDDTLMPVQWLTLDGEPCDADDAVMFLVGSDERGWVCEPLMNYEPVWTN